MNRIIDRFDEYMALKRLNDNKVTTQLNLSNGVIGKSRKEGRDLSRRVIELIEKFYTDLNIDWLITGEGEMLRQPGSNDSQIAVNDYSNTDGKPYYAVDFIAGFDLVFNDQTRLPDSLVSFPNIRGADLWVDISGKSMEPLISSGDIVALKKIENWQENILYGEVYALVTFQYRTVKRIRRSDRPGYIRLVPENPDYDSQDIAATSVQAVFQVLGCAKKIF